MARKIQFKRGAEADLPVLDNAEFAFTTDTKRLYIGSSDGNIELAKKSVVDTLLANVAIYPTNFGTVGLVDDTAVLQAAINYCATNKLKLSLSTGVTYNVTKLDIKDNLVIEGNGATLHCIGSSVDHVLGADIGTGVQNVKISNININADGKSVNGISFKGTKCIVDSAYVYGMSNPSVSYYGIRIRSGSVDVLVSNSRVDLVLDSPVGTFSGLSGIATTGTSVDNNGGLNTSTSIQPATEVNTNIRFLNCVVYGGTHGIGVIASEHCRVTGCSVSYSTHRCIVVSQNSSFNEIKNNKVTQFGSSGIHVNAGSNDNIIQNNKLFSDGTFKPWAFGGGGGESALQCYLKSQNNKFLNNVVDTKSTNYAFYSFDHCDGLIVDGNTLQGGFFSVIGIESDALPRPLLSNQPYSRPNFAAVTDMNPAMTSWDNGDGFSNITITNNRIIRPIQDSLTNCGIYIAQIGSAVLQNLVLANNTINSNDPSGHDIYISAVDKTKFLNSMITNNKATPTEDYRLHFDDLALIDYSENSWQKVARGSSTAVTSIDFSLTDYFYANNASSSISAFTKPMMANGIMRKVYIRLAIGAKLVHSTATFRLSGAATITGVTGNETIELMYVNGVFIQV